MDIHAILQAILQPQNAVYALLVAAFLVGALRPWAFVFNGSAFIENVVLFVPRAFIDVLDMVHTKRFKYYGLILALLAIEAFFAFRASTVYFDVLSTHVETIELLIVCLIVFVAIFLCGYMVATHTENSWQMYLTIALVVAHDWAGTVYMNYSRTQTVDPGQVV